MDNDKNVPAEKSCASECACKKKTSGLSSRTRLFFLIIIVVVAGAVLANSIKKKSVATDTATQSGYTVKAPIAPGTVPASQSSETKSTYTATAKAALQSGTFVRLAAFSSLDTLANGFDGIFVLLVNKEEEKTASVTSAIDSAIKAIGSRNIKIGLFQLAGTSPDFNDVATQMPPPCVLVLVKGKGMRGVRGNDISTSRLLQAYTGAMQPSGCCPSGSAGGCK
jgi:hypothetical protein